MGRTGHEKKSLGPSDSSDSGSDIIGVPDTADDLEGTGDREGTGEGLPPEREPEARAGSDIGPDRIVGSEEAGLGDGLDEAEEANVDPVNAKRPRGAERDPVGER
jgi:hypothetical protein